MGGMTTGPQMKGSRPKGLGICRGQCPQMAWMELARKMDRPMVAMVAVSRGSPRSRLKISLSRITPKPMVAKVPTMKPRK